MLKPSLDLSGVIGFAIVGGTSMRTTGAAPVSAPDAGLCTPSTLYALQADGSMQVTTVTETQSGDAGTQCNTSMQTETASALFDTPKYELIAYSPSLQLSCDMTPTGGMCPMCPFVVLRKSDGALFCGGTMSAGSQLKRVEGEGDVLYIQDSSFERLDMAANPPTETSVDSMDFIQTFDVDAANNALTAGNFGERIFKANGGLQNISTQTSKFQWYGPDGDFYYFFMSQPGPPDYGTYQLVQLASGTYAPTTLSFFGNFGLGPDSKYGGSTATQAYTWATANGTTALVEIRPTAAGGVCNGTQTSAPPVPCTSSTQCSGTCIPNGGGGNSCSGGTRMGMVCTTDQDCADYCTNGGVAHGLNGIPHVLGMETAGSTIFVVGTDNAGNGLVSTVDAGAITEPTCCSTANCCPFVPGMCCSSPLTPTTLLAPGDYSVSAFSLSRAGELTFAGLRNSDGAHVVGNCVTGACSVLNASAPVVTALQRIN